MQRQITGILPRIDDPSTVQGCLEMALNSLKTKNMPFMVTSSRTDSGVHALSSTCHVDIETDSGNIYEPTFLTAELNKFLLKQDVLIKVVNTFAVPMSFHSRHSAIARTYLYRFVRIKPHPSISMPLLQHIPIEHSKRTWFSTCSDFDENIMRDAAKLFLGFHDFKTFMGKGSQSSQIDKITRRFISDIKIEKASSNNYSYFSIPLHGLNRHAEFEYFNIYIKAPGFLYNQVRRTVGCIIAAAQGKISVKDIKFMLEIPSRHSWDTRIKPAPPYGLYLCQVHYRQTDIDTFKEFLQDQDGRV
ncbi:hypothetical protein WA026_008391 [Henosepilachna vigintioctopunctata]|uniref:tRNA pseudouridine synthase n=1 Tax=Henosepilachna vigintioctopunctata TaxID=420089 RepID=A0AAW1UGH5_9CUCU